MIAVDNPKWNTSLIKRYDLAGPRYTSYPTAPQFDENFTTTDLHAAITRSNSSGRPLSLYVHIPFCDTVCYYCACNKVITANKKRAQPYLNSLYREMTNMAALIKNGRPVDQLHWGGGTPTYISHAQMRELMAHTRQHFELRNDDSGEYAIEIHPGTTSPDTISLLRQLGFNRLSMGVQDFNPDVQQAVNRFNSVQEVQQLMERARAEGFHSVSMDLIYGLPKQTPDSIEQTIEQVIDLSPDRLSVFNYAHLPRLFKTQRQINENELPGAGQKLAMLEYLTKRLTAAGYVFIGMDHFARPDDELAQAQRRGELQRNFQGYSTHGNCDMFAFGVSAISAIDNVYVQNYKDIHSYSQAISSHSFALHRGITLNHDDLLRQYVIKQLICQFYLDFGDVESKFDICFRDYFANELMALRPLIQDSLVDLQTASLAVTADGRLLIRAVCMIFDAYLQRASRQSFSRVI